jgi:hypothetical protein
MLPPEFDNFLVAIMALAMVVGIFGVLTLVYCRIVKRQPPDDDLSLSSTLWPIQ